MQTITAFDNTAEGWERMKPAKKAPAKKATKGKGTKAAKKRAQRAVAKGDSYGCGACGETFQTMKAATKHALTHTS